MAYIDYDFYKNHSVSPIDENAFSLYELDAEYYLKEKTLGKSDSYNGEELKLATCKVVDSLYKYDNDETYIKADKGITSEKVGEYSVSYGGSSDLESKKANELNNILIKYLALTGLLYKGQDVL